MSKMPARTCKAAFLALALAASAPVAATLSASSAEAGWRHRHGGAIAVGVIGGLALGAMAAGAYAAPAYAHPAYAEPQPYAPACWWTRVRERVSHDTIVVRKVRVCE